MANSNFTCTLNVTVSGNTISAYMRYSRSGSFTYSDTALPTPTMTIAGTNFNDTAFANKVHSGVTLGALNSTTFSKSVSNGTYTVKWTCGSGYRSDFAGTWSKSVTVNTGVGPSSISLQFDSATWNSVTSTTTIGSWGSGYNRTNIEQIVCRGSATASNWEQTGRIVLQHMVTGSQPLTNTDTVSNATATLVFNGGIDLIGCTAYKNAAFASTFNSGGAIGRVALLDDDNLRYTPPYDLTSLSKTSESYNAGSVDVTLTGVMDTTKNADSATIGYQYRTTAGGVTSEWLDSSSTNTSKTASPTIQLAGLNQNTNYTVEVRQYTIEDQTGSTQYSGITSVSFTTGVYTPLYGSVNGETKLLKKIYGPTVEYDYYYWRWVGDHNIITTFDSYEYDQYFLHHYRDQKSLPTSTITIKFKQPNVIRIEMVFTDSSQMVLEGIAADMLATMQGMGMGTQNVESWISSGTYPSSDLTDQIDMGSSDMFESSLKIKKLYGSVNGQTKLIYQG